MHDKVVWINIKASNLGKAFLLLAYISLLLLVIWPAPALAQGFVPLILLHAWWSWRQAFGAAAPIALQLKNNQLSVQLAQGQLQVWKPPLLLFSRYCLVFKRPGILAWPWMLWPDSVSHQEHHQLRFFLRAWH